MEKKLIIWIDSGDTIIDEATQQYDTRGIVTSAECIPEADKMLKELKNQGYKIVMVADGELESFDNVYQKNGLKGCFDEWVISEVVGVQKPNQKMFETAWKTLKLSQDEKKRIVMIGNNLKKDIAGANRFGITSIWLDWSPRYYHEYEQEDWKPDYIVHTPEQIIRLVNQLNDEVND